MLAAIYARKSTDQSGVNEEEKSVTRQIEHACAYALKKSWTVADDHIYVDDGVSGAEFVKRPGFIQLMRVLKPRPPFQILLMSEESRLGREQIQTAYALQQITDAGVRVFYYLTDQERKLDTAMDKMMVSLTNFGAELEREKASQRVHDALRKKAAALYVTGCKVYGYDNQEVCNAEGQRLHVIRVKNPDECTVLLRIFERYAAGEGGLATIAKELNAHGVPPPRGTHGWAPTCLRAMLRRPLYRGVVVWNKTQAIHRGGTQTSRKRPAHEWLTFDAPDLRIIPEHLWTRVEKKLVQHAAVYTRKPDGKLIGRPNGAAFRSAYLLSGIAECGVCGGSLVSYKRKKKDGLDKYICSYHHTRGATVCANSLRISQATLDSALLHGLRAVLDDQIVAEAVRRALVEIRAGHTTFPTQRVALERQLSLVEARLRHLVELAATGRMTDTVYAELLKEEAAKKALAVQLEDLDTLVRATDLDVPRVERVLKAKVASLHDLLKAPTSRARHMLQRLIEGRVVCTPFADARGRGYTVKATGSYAALFSAVVGANDGGGEGGI
jgi:DNA invertase Pin-like site-specific DNA recombinase